FRGLAVELGACVGLQRGFVGVEVDVGGEGRLLGDRLGLGLRLRRLGLGLRLRRRRGSRRRRGGRLRGRLRLGLRFLLRGATGRESKRGQQNRNLLEHRVLPCLFVDGFAASENRARKKLSFQASA